MLETIWFAIWGVAWAVYLMLDGFDLGLGTLLPFIARNESERRLVFNAMGPFWDGNEVWLITAGGVTFAAFPRAYAIMFSGLYLPLMLLLLALIMRGVTFEFRGKIDSNGWRRLWDACLVFGSFVPALLLGVTFANLFSGMPIDAEGLFQGTLFTLLTPYGLLGGALFVLMFALHGALWLAIRTQGDLKARAARFSATLYMPVLGVAVVFLGATWVYTPLWQNLLRRPLLLTCPALAVVALLAVFAFLRQKKYGAAWLSSSAFIVFAALFGVAGMFPNLLMSTVSPEASINVHNSCSSPLTLSIMLGVVASFLPVVIGYQAWTYLTFRKPLTQASLEEENSY